MSRRLACGAYRTQGPALQIVPARGACEARAQAYRQANGRFITGFPMQVRFADARPQGAYDLALIAPQNGEAAGLPAANAGLARAALRGAPLGGEGGATRA